MDIDNHVEDKKLFFVHAFNDTPAIFHRDGVVADLEEGVTLVIFSFGLTELLLMLISGSTRFKVCIEPATGSCSAKFGNICRSPQCLQVVTVRSSSERAACETLWTSNCSTECVSEHLLKRRGVVAEEGDRQYFKPLEGMSHMSAKTLV